MHLDKQQSTPIYLQLKEMLQNQIEQGVYSSHQKLPSERDLCQRYDLSRMTARRALKQLIAEGLAYTRVGKGTFVSYAPSIIDKSSDIIDQSRFLSLTDNIVERHCRQKLINQLLSFNCVGVEQIIREVLVNHSFEALAFSLFPRVIQQLEWQWYNNEISLLVQNYAMTTLRSQLISMVNAITTCESGPKIVLACAPEDQHEIGLLLLALSLRGRGFLVIYLGPNVTTTGFHQIIDIVQPRLVCFSAATTQAARSLALLSQEYQSIISITESSNGQSKQKALFTFGGVAFTQNQSLISTICGLYLGNDLKTAILKIQELLL